MTGLTQKHWFRFRLIENALKENTCELCQNEIARSMVDTLLPTYEFNAKEMEDEAIGESIDTMRLTGQKYLEHQLSWFGKTYNIENNLKNPEDGLQKFIEFLEKHAKSGEGLSDKESKIEFRKEFALLHDQIFQVPYSVRNNKGRAADVYGLDLMNTELEKHSINYKVTSDKKAVWRVIKLTENVAIIDVE